MSKIFLKMESICFVIIGTIMTIVMFINACGRYVFGSTFLWAEETVRICFVWAMFIAISELFLYGGHIGFDVVSSKNKWTGAFAKIVTNIVLIILGINLVYFGKEIIEQVGNVPLASTKLPNMVFQIPGILAGISWIIIGISELAGMIIHRKKDDGEVKE